MDDKQYRESTMTSLRDLINKVGKKFENLPESWDRECEGYTEFINNLEKPTKTDEQRLREIGIGKRYIRDYKPNEKQQKVLDGIEKTGKGFFLAGDIGIGKTQLLAFIAKKNLHRNIKYYDCNYLLNQFKQMESIDQPDIILLDDFGWENPSDYAINQFVFYLKERYNNEQLTYIASNITAEVIKNKRFDAYTQILDLIMDKTWMSYIELSGQSLRGTK